MVKYGQFVFGCSGAGKTRYCEEFQEYFTSQKRYLKVINLDPDNYYSNYKCFYDIKDLISSSSISKEIKLGGNGEQMFCLEYFFSNIQHLIESINDDSDDSYYLFDCMGNLDSVLGRDLMKNIIKKLEIHAEFRIVTVFICDWTHISRVDSYIKLLDVTLTSQVHLECPHINVISKVDMLNNADKKKIIRLSQMSPGEYLERNKAHLTTRAVKLFELFVNEFETQLLSFDLYNLNIKSEGSKLSLLHIINTMLQIEDSNEINIKYGNEDLVEVD